MLRKPAFWILVAILGAVIVLQYANPSSEASAEPDATPVRIRCLVGGPDPYWNSVIAGAESGAAEFNADLDVIVPQSTSSAVDEQNAALISVNYDKVDGLMLSPLSPREQTRLISQAAVSTPVVTFDNEAPEALAHYHVGADNKNGGRLLADLVRRAMPDGGEIALFAGDNVRETARVRRQVLINTLAGQKPFDDVSDDLEEPIKAGEYTVVATYLDDRDANKARENASLALRDHPAIGCLVGLYSKNGPACADAVSEAGKANDVVTIAFDQLDETLEGIRTGAILATVAQDPESYGYEAVRLLCMLHRNQQQGKQSRFSGRITVACQIVDAENLEEFEASQSDHSTSGPGKLAQPEDAK